MTNATTNTLTFTDADYGIITLEDGAVIDAKTGALLMAPAGMTEDEYLVKGIESDLAMLGL